MFELSSQLKVLSIIEIQGDGLIMISGIDSLIVTSNHIQNELIMIYDDKY